MGNYTLINRMEYCIYNVYSENNYYFGKEASQF